MLEEGAIRPASTFSSVSADGETFSLFAAKHEEQLEAYSIGVTCVPADDPLTCERLI
jgi:hypothetical protein